MRRTTDSPELFMNVIGFARTTVCPKMVPEATIALFCIEVPHCSECRFASSSKTRKPTLCRVLSYVGPGFPSPTSSHRDCAGVPDSVRADFDPFVVSLVVTKTPLLEEASAEATSQRRLLWRKSIGYVACSLLGALRAWKRGLEEKLRPVRDL